MGMRICITGANRGIGLGLTTLMLERGDEVYACARDLDGADDLLGLRHRFGERLHLCRLDATAADSIAAVAADIAGGSLDLLLNNAGTYGQGGGLLALDLADCANTFAVNVLGPLRVVQAFLPALRQPGAKVVNISSRMGSIGDNGGGGSYGYRIAKAGLNMASKNLALELTDRGIAVLALHPGWVQTRMGGAGAPLTVAAATAGMLDTIDRLTLSQTGQFLQHDGTPLPW